MEKRITFYPPQTWRGRFLGTILTLVALLLGATQVKAQDVYIRPGSGSVVTSVSSADDSGFILGLGALWRHEQLALSMTGSDRDGIKTSGEISQPSTVIGERDGMLTLVGGRRPSFLVVSLPKGYRITGYDLVLVNNLVGVDYAPGKNTGSGHNAFHHLNGNQNDNELASGRYGTMRFYETTPWTNDGTNSPVTQGNYNLNDVRKIEPADIGSTILATAHYGTEGTSDYDINIDATEEDTNKEFTISRHNIEGTNQLYFRLVKNYTHYGISIKSFHIFFTAEGTFDAPATPIDVDHARRVVSYSFKTNKIDIGKMSNLTQEGHEGDADYTAYSYDFRNVTDLDAYTYIYQERAIQDGVPYELESDAQGNIEPHIYPVKFGDGDDAEHLFAFENDTYFVEPPTTVHTSSGLEAPIGYRIVGAKIEYLWKDAVNITKTIPDGFYIVYDRVTTTSSGAQTTHYYLNENLQFVTNQRPVWKMDDKGNIYYNTNPNRFLSCEGTGSTRNLSWATNPDDRWNLRTEDREKIYYYSDGLNYYNLQAVVNASGVPTGTQVVRDALNNLPYSEYQTGGHTVTTCAYSPGTYTLNIWDQQTGNTIDASKSVQVTEAKAKSSQNYVELKDLNNDAIKFSISGLDDGKQALLLITLQLQALNPYINNMLVECKNLPKELQMSQSFTASDFSVSGGSFIFYVPSDLVGETMDISFSDLYSNYGDKTYWGETASITNSRYSFVTSDYFKLYSGNQVAGVTGFPVNGGLYDAAYTPNTDYTTKVTTATAGNVRYKFNNAEDLADPLSQSSDYLEEYPFTVTKYLSNYPNPDGSTPATAKFEECHVIAGDGTQDAGSFFVFTAGETRYNIAPTTDWQHRFYAFYRMDVKAVAKSYYPALEWTRVYDSALYTTKDADDNEVKGEKAQFGLKLLTKEKLDNGQVGDFVTGYLTVKEVNDAIAAAIEAENETPTGDVPTSRDQILYIDCSSLIGVYNYIKTEGGQPEPATLENLMEGLGTNALIYLPSSTSTQLDNFAFYEPEINSFRAANNIVLTDKQPFYSKYDIQIDPANTVSYVRKISDALNGQAKLATIMLPFALSLDKTNGVHTNPSETPVAKFSVNIMSAYDADGNVIDMKDEKAGVDYGTAYFTPLKRDVAEANTPYMINVESTSAGEDDDFSFVVAEKGAKIISTVIDGEDNTKGTGWLHSDEGTVGVKYGSDSYTFTNKATFSGAKFDRAKSEDVFYFANNKYLDLHTLQKYKDNIQDEAHLQQYLYIYPFRGVYTYTRTAGTSGAKRMQWFNISFDEPTHGVATDITSVSDADLIVKTGKGIVTMTATRSQDVNINTLSGMSMKRVDLNAGDTKTVNLPAGIYMINNVKVIVK